MCAARVGKAREFFPSGVSTAAPAGKLIDRESSAAADRQTWRTPAAELMIPRSPFGNDTKVAGQKQDKGFHKSGETLETETVAVEGRPLHPDFKISTAGAGGIRRFQRKFRTERTCCE